LFFCLIISSGLNNSNINDFLQYYRRNTVKDLFDFIWLKNGAYSWHQNVLQKHKCNLQLNRINTPIQGDGVVVTDILNHLLLNPCDGVIVDSALYLTNPVDLKYPLNGLFNFPGLCKILNISESWLFCSSWNNSLAIRNILPSSKRSLTVGIYNSLIDNGKSCHAEVPGTIFNANATYYFQRWTKKSCYKDFISLSTMYHSSSIIYYHEIINPLGAYYDQPGHFIPEILPRLIRTLLVVPSTSILLIKNKGFIKEFMDILIDLSILNTSRVVNYDKQYLYHANVVYRSEAYPYLTGNTTSYHLYHRTDMELVRRLLAPVIPTSQRLYIVLIRRRPGPRELVNFDEVFTLLQTLPFLPFWEIKIFSAVNGTVREYIELFRRAVVVIGVHGAGLANIVFCAPGTHVIEIGYDRGMALPDMYAQMSMHLDLNYWLVAGYGAYDNAVAVDFEDLETVFHRIIENRWS